AGDGRAQGVAYEIENVVILHQLRVLRKDGAFLRSLDIFFQFGHPALAGELVNVEQHLEAFGIGLAGERTTADHPERALEDLDDQGEGVGDEYRSERRTTDDNELRGLKQNRHLSLSQKEAADDRAEDYDNSND